MISATHIIGALDGKASTFAGIDYITKIQTAAKHKGVHIQKYTTANIQLFSNLKEANKVYTNAVKKAAGKINENDATKVAEFTSQENYFNHTNCFSLVAHKVTGKQYLYAFFNNAESIYTINGKIADKEQVAEYLTPSARERLLGDGIVHNKANDILHTVQVRTIALENIVELRTNGRTLKV